MSQGTGIREQGTGSAPVRGTQSFVGVMAAVFRRPSLTGIEILWRWAFGAVVLAAVWWKYSGAMLTLWSEAQLTTTSALPAKLVGSFVDWFPAKAVERCSFILLFCCLAWAIVSAVGRDALLRRLESTLRTKRSTVAALAMLRVLSFMCVLAIWMLCFVPLARWAVLEPLAHHNDPAYVFAFAVVVCFTLALFVVWSLTSWIFRIAPVLAMAHNLSVSQSLRAALRSGALRGKLIEINFVMGIVKIALIVLAMVFSACPLPFSSVETQTFLTLWWIGVGVLYVLASDYFHVVRAAAYITLWRAYESGPYTEPQPAIAAS